MNDTNSEIYVQYFRWIATQHTALLHNPLSETGDAPASSMHFAKWNLNELTGSLRTKCSFPVLLLEMFEIKTDAESVYDIRQGAQGAITILDHVPEGDIPGEEIAYAKCEKILFDILRFIWQQHYGPDADRCETPFRKFDFNSLDIASTGKILQNEMGWRVEFNFTFQQTANLSTPPTENAFLSI